MDRKSPGAIIGPDELAQAVYPLIQPAAQVRELRRQGLPVRVRPDGRPYLLVAELGQSVTKANRPSGIKFTKPKA